MTRPARTLLIIFVAVIAAVAVLTSTAINANPFGPRPTSLRYDQFVGYLNSKRIRSLVWQQNEISGKLDDGAPFSVEVPDRDSMGGNRLVAEIEASGARFEYGKPTILEGVLSILSVIAFPLMILAVIYFLLIKPSQSRLRNPIAMFSESASKETDSFTIPVGRGADIQWSATYDVGGIHAVERGFSATLMHSDDRSRVQLLANVEGDGHWTTRCYRQGEFYIQVTADIGWTILVYLK